MSNYEGCEFCANQGKGRCATCTPIDPMFESIYSEDGEIGKDRNPYESTNCYLEDQLEEAKSAAVQWVTYDGMIASLPKQQKSVLLMLWGGDRTRIAYWFGSSRMWHFENGEVCHIKNGDRWAYLPTPPEEGKNEIL